MTRRFVRFALLVLALAAAGAPALAQQRAPLTAMSFTDGRTTSDQSGSVAVVDP